MIRGALKLAALTATSAVGAFVALEVWTYVDAYRQLQFDRRVLSEYVRATTSLS